MTRTRVRAIVLLGCLALIVASLAGPRQASAQSDQWDALFDRMIRLEHEVKAMKGGGGAVPLNPSAMGNSGAVEDQLRQVMAMLDQIRQTQRSLEMRLERLEGTSGGTTGSIYEPQSQTFQSQAPYGQSETNSFDFSQYESRELAQLSAEQDVTIYRDYEPQTVAQPQVLGTLSGTQAYGQGYQTQGYQPQGYQTQTYEQGQPASTGGYGRSDVSSSLLPETVESASLDSAALPATGGSSAASSEARPKSSTRAATKACSAAASAMPRAASRCSSTAIAITRWRATPTSGWAKPTTSRATTSRRPRASSRAIATTPTAARRPTPCSSWRCRCSSWNRRPRRAAPSPRWPRNIRPRPTCATRRSRRCSVPAAEAAEHPVSSQEAAELLNPLRLYRHVGLAVSGGGDSMSLMWLAAQWAGQTRQPPKLTVLSVDHGLRPGSAEDANWVVEQAGALGLAGAMLQWHGAKPTTGVQARARQARYDLLIGWCIDHGAGALVTAHSLEDQAETFLMRLARGSGVDGLSAMRPAREEEGREDRIAILRPLLGVSGARLRSTLTRPACAGSRTRPTATRVSSACAGAARSPASSRRALRRP
jgi:tRNA(Ile)-lysidine synthetase-like protein